MAAVARLCVYTLEFVQEGEERCRLRMYAGILQLSGCQGN